MKKIITIFLLVLSATFIDAQNCVLELKECAGQYESCTIEKLQKYVTNNIKYPSLALENGNEGTMIFSIEVNSKGHVDDFYLAHSFYDGKAKSVNKLLKGDLIKNLEFSGIECEDGPKSIKVNIPAYFYLDTKKPSALWNFSDIFCNNHKDKEIHYSVRLKQFKKYVESAEEIEKMWKYNLNLAEFECFSLLIKNEDGEEIIKNLTSLSDRRFTEAISTLSKKDILEFEIIEKDKTSKVRVFIK